MPLWRRAFIGSSSRFNEVFARGHMFVACAATPARATFHTRLVFADTNCADIGILEADDVLPQPQEYDVGNALDDLVGGEGAGASITLLTALVVLLTALSCFAMCAKEALLVRGRNDGSKLGSDLGFTPSWRNYAMITMFFVDAFYMGAPSFAPQVRRLPFAPCAVLHVTQLTPWACADRLVHLLPPKGGVARCNSRRRAQCAPVRLRVCGHPHHCVVVDDHRCGSSLQGPVRWSFGRADTGSRLANLTVVPPFPQ